MKGVKRVANKGKARSLDDGMVIEERRLARVERRAHSRQQWKPRLQGRDDRGPQRAGQRACP